MDRNLSFDTTQAADLLGLLANDARLQVLHLISEREWDVNSLAAQTQLSQSALSQHLKKMRDMKVVRTRRDAQTIYYSCRDESVAKILATLTEVFSTAQSPEAVAA
jgi:DNA-binding transcriptional ArsR family regulator